MIEKLIFTLIGVIVSVFTAWFSFAYKNRQRKSIEAEQASLAWLNSQSEVLNRLRKLSLRVTKEPTSDEEVEALMISYEELVSELKSLQIALNRAFIYVSRKRLREELEVQFNHIEQLVEMIEIIVRHHRQHVVHKADIQRVNDLILEADTFQKAEAAAKGFAQESQLKKVVSELESIKNESEAHLKTCTTTLIEDAKGLVFFIKIVEQGAVRIREILT